MRKYFLAIILPAITFAACKKSHQEPATGYIGSWQWVSSVGGIGAATTTPASTGINETLVLKADSTYAIYYNAATENGIFHIKQQGRAGGIGTENIITFQSGSVNASPYKNIIELRNDTLIISTTFTWEGTVSRYARKR